jgi:hypothetical protein
MPGPNRLTTISEKIRHSWSRRQNDRRIRQLAHQVGLSQPELTTEQPVIFFNASTRLTGMSLNAAFSLLSAWSLRMQGIKVVHFVCKAGMSRCVLGTHRDAVHQGLPCAGCIAHSQIEYTDGTTTWFTYTEDAAVAAELNGLDIDGLSRYQHGGIPLGALVLPALRWELRRHNLKDDEPTRFLFSQFILSAWNIAREFTALLDRTNPQAVILFNGQFFPEATVRFLARQRGIRTICHEVGMLPFTAFFTEGEATAYPIDIPESFQLSEVQNARLDAYLEKRFQGNFKMAGIQFWPTMQPLDEEMLKKIAAFKQVVPVFTNVIFDTSQPHSNVVFTDMFAWLDTIHEIAKAHPETLFVIRAHPDELRPGSAKQSRETVRDWVKNTGIDRLDNVIFIDSLEYLSSYDLIQRAKFVMVYNSSIGLEAALMGAAVLSGGKGRYTQLPMVFFPKTVPDFRSQAEEWLASASIQVPPEYSVNARRFLYYQLYRTALPFSEFLEESFRPGLVRLRPFSLERLLPGNSRTMDVILKGILHHGDFFYEDSDQ